MKHTTEQHMISCGCRSVGECNHNLFAEQKALTTCVDDFAYQMKTKLISKANQGKSGWDDERWSPEDIKQQLLEHLEKGDMIDMANFAMFAWNQQS